MYNNDIEHNNDIEQGENPRKWGKELIVQAYMQECKTIEE